MPRMDYNASLFYVASSHDWAYPRAKARIESAEPCVVHMPYVQVPRIQSTLQALFDEFVLGRPWPESNVTVCKQRSQECHHAACCLEAFIGTAGEVDLPRRLERFAANASFLGTLRQCRRDSFRRATRAADCLALSSILVVSAEAAIAFEGTAQHMPTARPLTHAPGRHHLVNTSSMPSHARGTDGRVEPAVAQASTLRLKPGSAAWRQAQDVFWRRPPLDYCMVAPSGQGVSRVTC